MKVGSTLIERRTITDVFEAVEGKRESLGVVPVQNSLEGPVNETLDNLFGRKDLYLNNVIELKVNLVLASLRPDRGFERVYSHSHALREIRKDVLERLRAEVIPVESTSHAAILASKDESSAAICSDAAARLYGLKLISEGLQEVYNITKFGVISKEFTKKVKER